jgi:F-type H+-transporting ATPase subunit b
MEEILYAFGIDARLIAIQIFNFALLAAALWYFLYRPVLNLIESREAKIAQGVRDAEAAAAEKAAAESERATVLKAASTEADLMLERAREHAAEKEAALVAEAEAKAARTLKNAELAAAELSRRAAEASEAEIAKVALLTAEKLLRERRSS